MSIYTGYPIPEVVVNVAMGATYTITPGASETGLWLVNGSQTVTMSVGVPFNIVAQGTTITFQYPNLVNYSNLYPGGGTQAAQVVHSTSSSTINVLWGINESGINPGVGARLPSAGPGNSSVLPNGSYPWEFFPVLGVGAGSQITSAIYVPQSGVPFTAQIYLLHPAAVIISQLTTLQLYTSKLGGVDYRFGSDFVLVNNDPICTTFNTPNLNLPFVFPVGSTSKLNSAITPIIQPR